MTKTYKIERGIKMPAPGKVGGVAPSKAMETMRLMKVGDSFVVRDVEEGMRAGKTMRDLNGRERTKEKGMRFASRSVKQGLRIWRTQ